jgi:hypothetical protein
MESQRRQRTEYRPLVGISSPNKSRPRTPREEARVQGIIAEARTFLELKINNQILSI